MLKPLFATVALATSTNFAAAQSPTFAFQPVGTTGKLLTTESRDYWAKMSAKLKAADKASDRVTDALGLPHVHAATAMATAKAVAPNRPQRAAAQEPTVLLTPDRRRAGLTVGGDGGR